MLPERAEPYHLQGWVFPSAPKPNWKCLDDPFGFGAVLLRVRDDPSLASPGLKSPGVSDEACSSSRSEEYSSSIFEGRVRLDWTVSASRKTFPWSAANKYWRQTATRSNLNANLNICTWRLFAYLHREGGKGGPSRRAHQDLSYHCTLKTPAYPVRVPTATQPHS